MTVSTPRPSEPNQGQHLRSECVQGEVGSHTSPLVGVVVAALDECASYELTLPWLLVCRDPGGGAETFSGPWASRAEAEVVLIHERLNAGDDGQLEFRVEPLYPPLDLRQRSASRGADAENSAHA